MLQGSGGILRSLVCRPSNFQVKSVPWSYTAKGYTYLQYSPQIQAAAVNTSMLESLFLQVSKNWRSESRRNYAIYIVNSSCSSWSEPFMIYHLLDTVFPDTLHSDSYIHQLTHQQFPHVHSSSVSDPDQNRDIPFKVRDVVVLVLRTNEDDTVDDVSSIDWIQDGGGFVDWGRRVFGRGDKEMWYQSFDNIHSVLAIDLLKANKQQHGFN